MTHIERVEMPDGTVILARIEEQPGQGGVDVGLRDHLKLENFTGTISSVAKSVHAGVAALHVDKVSVEFGLEFSADSRGIVAVLASGGAKASVKVKLDWDRKAPAEADLAVDGEQAEG